MEAEYEEIDDDFIAPETDPAILAACQKILTRRLAEEEEERSEAACEPSENSVPTDVGVAVLVAEEQEVIKIVDLTEEELLLDDCTVEASKWTGNNVLRYSCALVKALSETLIREQDVDECNCAESDVACVPGKCVNFATHIECTVKNCCFGTSNCGNKRVPYSKGPCLSLVKVPAIPGGFGCKTDEPIGIGEFVGEYVGEVISHQVMRVR